MKSDKAEKLQDRVRANYTALCSAAIQLNLASDDMREAVAALSEHLKRLGLGVSAWYDLATGESKVRSVGYTKLGSNWGIAIRQVTQLPNQEREEEIWLFGDAPRWMRIEAVAHIPDLLEALLARTCETTEKSLGATQRVRLVTEAIADVVTNTRKEQNSVEP